MIKWKLEKWNDRVHRIECVSETEKTVLHLGDGRGSPRREHKVSNYHKYFDSWSEAHAALLARLEREAESARNKLASVSASLDRVRAMTGVDNGEV